MHPGCAAYLARLEAAPDDAEALHGLGGLLAAIGAARAALTVYRRLVAHDPGDAAAQVGLGNLLHQAGDPEAARAHYQAALLACPDFPEAHQGLGNLCAARGDSAMARGHWQLGYRERVFNAWSFHGAGTPVRLLLLLSVAGGNVRARSFVDDGLYAVTAVACEFFTPAHALPPHDLILNAIGDADLCKTALAAATALVARSTAPVVNAPAAVAQTGRAANAARLGAIEGVVTPLMATVPRLALMRPDGASVLSQHGLSFPLLLRAEGFHTGQHFTRVAGPDSLAAAAAPLPGETVLAMAYLDAAGADRCFRKGRVMVIGGRLYPLHWAVSADWKVHYFTAGMEHDSRHREEEARFLADMTGFLGARAVTALAAAGAALGLDYAGIDFALSAGGDVLIFEANATMVILAPPEGAMWDYRRAAAARALEAARGVLVEKEGSASF